MDLLNAVTTTTSEGVVQQVTGDRDVATASESGTGRLAGVQLWQRRGTYSMCVINTFTLYNNTCVCGQGKFCYLFTIKHFLIPHWT